MFGGYAFLIAGPGTVSGNTVANSSAYGIYIDSLAPTTVSGNTVTNTFDGIYSFSPCMISGNTVTNTTYGILGFADGISATSNKISNASLIAIYVHNSDDSVQSNTITHAYVGIGVDCKTATVLHNTINDATSGMELVPVGFSGANTFNNVETLSYGNCGSASVHGPDLLTAPHAGPIPMRALP
jgi:parallel beta-helix repeat protein